MRGSDDHSALWLREQAARSFRLAEQAWDDTTHDALTEYGQELLHRAEKLERVSRLVERPVASGGGSVGCLLGEVQRWRSKAEEARAMAENLANAVARDSIIGISRLALAPASTYSRVITLSSGPPVNSGGGVRSLLRYCRG